MNELKNPESTLNEHPVSQLLDWSRKEANLQESEVVSEGLSTIFLTLISAAHDFVDSDKNGKYWAQTSMHNKLAKEIMLEWEK